MTVVKPARRSIENRLEKRMTADLYGDWKPSDVEPPDASSEVTYIEYPMEIDPRVVTNHRIGELPCPANPPPPDGWEYVKANHKNPKGALDLCVKMLYDPAHYPMGAFVQAHINGELVGARVEWHKEQGATGKRGCFRGVNLMQKVPA